MTLAADSRGKGWGLGNFYLFLCIFQYCLDLQTNEQYPYTCYSADSVPVLEVLVQPFKLWREQYQGSADNEDKLQTSSSWFLKYRVSEALFSVSYSYIHASNMHFTTAAQMHPITTQLLNQPWHPVPNRSKCGLLHFLADHHSPRMTSRVLYLNVFTIDSLHLSAPHTKTSTHWTKKQCSSRRLGASESRRPVRINNPCFLIILLFQSKGKCEHCLINKS